MTPFDVHVLLTVVGGLLILLLILIAGFFWAIAHPLPAACAKCTHKIDKHRLPDARCVERVPAGANELGYALRSLCACPGYVAAWTEEAISPVAFFRDVWPTRPRRRA